MATIRYEDLGDDIPVAIRRQDDELIIVVNSSSSMPAPVRRSALRLALKSTRGRRRHVLLPVALLAGLERLKDGARKHPLTVMAAAAVVSVVVYGTVMVVDRTRPAAGATPVISTVTATATLTTTPSPPGPTRTVYRTAPGQPIISGPPGSSGPGEEDPPASTPAATARAQPSAEELADSPSSEPTVTSAPSAAPTGGAGSPAPSPTPSPEPSPEPTAEPSPSPSPEPTTSSSTPTPTGGETMTEEPTETPGPPTARAVS